MTIQDISNILTVIEEMNITKAAERLYLTQPSLSKCIMKVEEEYHIQLFHRNKGSSLALTEDGRLFHEMAVGVIQQHQLFLHRVEQFHSRNSTKIVFGLTLQRAYDMSSAIMRYIFDHFPGYNMELKTLQSRDIPQEIIAGNIDVALIPYQESDPRLFYMRLMDVSTYLYLRNGSDAGKLAKKVEGYPYPVLSLSAISGEAMVENVKGTSGRQAAETALRKNGAEITVIDQPLYSMRVTMVNGGYASTFVSSENLTLLRELDPGRLFCLPREENAARTIYLVCRKSFQRDKRFEILRQAIDAFYSSVAGEVGPQKNA